MGFDPDIDRVTRRITKQVPVTSDGDATESGEQQVTKPSSGAYTSRYVRNASSSGEIEFVKQMRDAVTYTLESRPPHFEAALRALDAVPETRAGYCFYGVIESGLDEDGMRMAFDFRRPAPNWSRRIFEVGMCYGKVSSIKAFTPRYKEPSGFDDLDRIPD